MSEIKKNSEITDAILLKSNGLETIHFPLGLEIPVQPRAEQKFKLVKARSPQSEEKILGSLVLETELDEISLFVQNEKASLKNCLQFYVETFLPYLLLRAVPRTGVTSKGPFSTV